MVFGSLRGINCRSSPFLLRSWSAFVYNAKSLPSVLIFLPVVSHPPLDYVTKILVFVSLLIVLNDLLGDVNARRIPFFGVPLTT